MKNKYFFCLLAFSVIFTLSCKELSFQSHKAKNRGTQSEDCPFPDPVLVVPETAAVGESLLFHTELFAAVWNIQTSDGKESFTGHDVELIYSEPGLYRGDVEGIDLCEYKMKYVFELTVFEQAAPRVQITSQPPKKEFTGVATFEFMGEAQSGGAITGYECTLDDQSAASCTSPIEYNDLETGKHHFSVVAKDEAGNVSEPAEYDWEVNLVLPQVHITKVPDHPTFDQFAIFEFVGESPAGIDHFLCALDGGGAMPCDSPYERDGLTVGEHHFSVMVVDTLGRKSDPAEFQWMIERRPTTVKEEFVSPGGSEAMDILFVVDNSASMYGEQRKMKRKMRNVFETIQGLDWQMAIITTDARGSGHDESGRFLRFAGSGKHYVINKETPRAERKFLDTIYRKDGGSNYEEGIHSLRKALQRKENQSFFREGAQLSVIIVADEDEGSSGSKLKKENQPEYLLELVKEKWSGSKSIAAHTLIWQPNAKRCHGAMVKGHTYARFSDLTGGIKGSVCAFDFGKELRDLPSYVGGGSHTHKLQCEALGGDVRVQYDPAPGFTIKTEVTGAQITFDPVPPKETRVQLEYECYVRTLL